MLSIDLFRNSSELILADHERRGLSDEKVQGVIKLDHEWRDSLKRANELRRGRNQAARRISEAKKRGDGEEFERVKTEVATLGARIEEEVERAKKLERERDSLRMRIPNILHASVPKGEDEEGNIERSLHGEKPLFDFTPLTHNELMEMNDWVDLPRAAKISGSRHYFLKGSLARLELALQTFAIDHLINKGYTFVQPPAMMNKESYEGVTDLGDFETVMYNVQPDDTYLVATAEHPLISMYSGEILEPSSLPIRLVGQSPSFRREVGAHGQSDKGIWRVHQFNKVEQIVFCRPEDSWGIFDELLNNAIEIWDELGLHYRVVDICTGDIGTVAAKKCDLEAWLPSVGRFKEVVSCSNCTDYQANRLMMRYRTSDGNDTLHTLNSTAVATSRALVAIMEQYQTAEGVVNVPAALRPYMGGADTIGITN